jgi:hypothetical protein
MSRKTTSSDILADPFQERGARVPRQRMRLLGCDFEFESDSPELRRIVDSAYAGLPRHKSVTTAPRIRIRLMLAPRGRKALPGEIPRIQMLSGADFLGATTSWSDFAVLSPAQRTGLIVVSRDVLRSPYHVRYELIEFAVFTLASRVLGLLGLHAACVGRGDRGVLLMGASGAGKSTAALHSLLSGLEFLSEDSVFVIPDSLLAMGVPNFLHVRQEGLRFIPKAAASLIRRSPVIRRRSGVAKFEVDLRRPEFRLARRPLRVVASVFMTAQRASDSRSLVRSLGRTDLLARLAGEQPYAIHQVGWPRFADGITRLPAFELRRGKHPNETVGALEDILVARAKHLAIST